MFAYAKPDNKKKSSKETIQRKDTEKPVATPNLTGIPGHVKTQFENQSGFSFNDIRVHYNSGNPEQLHALAYTRGDHVYVAPGQEKHLGHELAHVVQQKQGRVQPTMQLRGEAVNDDPVLEREADLLYSEYMSRVNRGAEPTGKSDLASVSLPVVQRAIGNRARKGDIVVSQYGTRWKIVALERYEDESIVYSVEYFDDGGISRGAISGISRRLMITEMRVDSNDDRWQLIESEETNDEFESDEEADEETDEESESDGETSEGYLSNDIDSPSDGEDAVLERPSTDTRIQTKIQTPKSAENRSARNIRAMRGSRRTPVDNKPFIVKLGDSYFEFCPNLSFKDYCVYPLTVNKKGFLQRNGKPKTYAELGRSLDSGIKKAGATLNEFNRCLEHILRRDSQATLEELKRICPRLDENCLYLLRELTAILRDDQARASQARKVIDEEVLSSTKSFTRRFGKSSSGKPPAYRGAKRAADGEGGVKALKESDREKYDPRKKIEKEPPAEVDTYLIEHLTDDELTEIINQAVDKKNGLALHVVNLFKGDNAAVIRYVRENHTRISINPNGYVMIHLRGG